MPKIPAILRLVAAWRLKSPKKTRMANTVSPRAIGKVMRTLSGEE
jgi:hypothetical protein